jgi:hypothetical protein
MKLSNRSGMDVPFERAMKPIRVILVCVLLAATANASRLTTGITVAAAASTILVNTLEIKTTIAKARAAKKAAKKAVVKVIRKVTGR